MRKFFVSIMFVSIVFLPSFVLAASLTLNNDSIENSDTSNVIVEKRITGSADSRTTQQNSVTQETPSFPLKTIRPQAKSLEYKVINTAGPKAPLVSMSKVLQKSPTRINNQTIRVIEFWATWCGPCRTTIPHLSKVQDRYGKYNVSIMGISNEDAAKVSPFLNKMGKKMNYGVGVDNNRKTSRAFSKLWNVGSIPHAYVIGHKGRILWHGHPGNRKFEMAIREAIHYRKSG